ncbi:TonB-dependent receptor domain-containing protein [Ottowia testudinis]|uniref:TonB-dependent receptor n=1 Tax=Ottowia testudinis TaxID=2816950 RepID=A0A975H221_9BURK|nr:TonB-dependent receptor [Ottowia testudinis]QTD44344.1 TonB-dependent receptor [Ottowia testudinis]
MNSCPRFELKPLILAVACAWGSTSAWAQPASNEPSSTTFVQTATLAPVVVTASQREQAIREAPASISVITRQELDAKPYTSVADVVRSIEGVSVVGWSSSDQDISIRGMPGEYTLILVDGKRQNTRETMNRGTGGVQSNLLPPMSAIERIEVVRGPMSSLYGADAMGGVVNVITRKVPRQWHGALSLGTVLQQEKNQGNTQSADFWLGAPIKDDVLGLQVSGRALRRGEDNIYFPANATSGANGQRIGSLDVKLTAKPSANQDITLNVGREQLSYLLTPGQTAAPLTVATAKTQIVKNEHDRDYWGLTHEGRWGFGNTTLALYGERGTQKQWTSVSQTPVEPQISNTTLEGKAVLPWSSGRSMLTIGGQYIWSGLTGAGQQDGVPKGYATNSDDIRRNSWALFAENDYFVTDKFTLTTGARFDHDDVYGNHVSPRLYGVYQMTPQWTLRGGVSSGFKAPKLRQSTAGYCMTTGGVAGAVPGTLCGNPSLKPETSVTQELGVRWDHGGDYASATLFNNLFKNQVTSYDTGRPDSKSPGRNVYTYDNISRVKLYGLELAAGKQVTREVRLSGNYTYTQSRREGGGESAFNGSSLDGYPLDKTPKHKLTAQVDWTPLPQLNLYAAANYSSPQYWAAFRNGAVGVRERPSSATFDIGGKWSIHKHMDVSFAVLNVTNKMVPVDERGRFGGLSGNWLVDEGRRLSVKLSAQF